MSHPDNKETSPEYPLGGEIEPYDIEREKEFWLDKQALATNYN